MITSSLVFLASTNRIISLCSIFNWGVFFLFTLFGITSVYISFSSFSDSVFISSTFSTSSFYDIFPSSSFILFVSLSFFVLFVSFLITGGNFSLLSLSLIPSFVPSFLLS